MRERPRGEPRATAADGPEPLLEASEPAGRRSRRRVTEAYGTLSPSIRCRRIGRHGTGGPDASTRTLGGSSMKKLLVLLILVVIGVAVAKKLREAT